MTTQAPLKVGVIGFGKLGLLHAAVVNGLKSAELVATADTSDVLLSVLKENSPRVNTYKVYERMLDEESLDAVFIASPTNLHVPMAMQCAKRNIPFFVEKPLGISGDDVRPLIKTANERKLTNMVGYMGRQIDTFAHAKHLLKDGPLGKLIHLRASMYVSQLFKKGKGWRYDKAKSGGGVLSTQNSHLIDLLQWYFGPVESVSGQVKSWYSGSVDDFAHAYFTFECGLTGYMDTSWSVRHHRMVEINIDVQGETGTLSVNDDTVRLFLDEPKGVLPSGWTQWRKPDLFRPVEIDVGGAQYTLQDAEFLSAVSEGRTVECDVNSALHVQEVIDAIYASSEDGGRSIRVKGDA